MRNRGVPKGTRKKLTDRLAEQTPTQQEGTSWPLLLTARQLREYCGIPESTSSKYRARGENAVMPPYVLVGGRVLYPKVDVDTWISNLPRNTGHCTSKGVGRRGRPKKAASESQAG